MLSSYAKLKQIIEEVNELSMLEQLELIQAVSSSVNRNLQAREETRSFLQGKSTEEIVAEQGGQVFQSVSDFAVNFWPEDESIDEFNDYVYGQRQEDRDSS